MDDGEELAGGGSMPATDDTVQNVELDAKRSKTAILAQPDPADQPNTADDPLVNVELDVKSSDLASSSSATLVHDKADTRPSAGWTKTDESRWHAAIAHAKAD